MFVLISESEVKAAPSSGEISSGSDGPACAKPVAYASLLPSVPSLALALASCSSSAAACMPAWTICASTNSRESTGLPLNGVRARGIVASFSAGISTAVIGDIAGTVVRP